MTQPLVEPTAPPKFTRGEAVACALVTVVAFAVRVVALRGTINWYNTEPFFYLFNTIEVLGGGVPFPQMMVHPSGYQYILAGVTWAFGIVDLVALGRWTSLAAGVAAVPAMFLLARRAYGPLVATAAAAALAVYDSHVLISVNSLNYAPFHAALLWGVALFHGGRGASDSWRRLAAAGLALSLAHALRFESWLLIPALTLALAAQKRWGKALALGALTGAYPLAYMVFAWRRWGTPFPFLEVSGGIDRGFTGLLDPAAALVWWRELWWALGPVALIAGLVGLALSLRAKRWAIPAYFSLFLGFYALRSMRGRFSLAGDFHRFDVLLLVFFLPLVFVPALAAARLPRGRWIAAALAAGLWVSFAVTSFGNYQFQLTVDSLADPPAHLGELIDWSAANLNPADSVCIDHGDHPELMHVLIEAKGRLSPRPHFLHDPCLEHGAACEPDENAWLRASLVLIERERCNVVFGTPDSVMARVAQQLEMPQIAAVGPYVIFRAAQPPDRPE
jgi:hypothetical protein